MARGKKKDPAQAAPTPEITAPTPEVQEAPETIPAQPEPEAGQTPATEQAPEENQDTAPTEAENPETEAAPAPEPPADPEPEQQQDPAQATTARSRTPSGGGIPPLRRRSPLPLRSCTRPSALVPPICSRRSAPCGRGRRSRSRAAMGPMPSSKTDFTFWRRFLRSGPFPKSPLSGPETALVGLFPLGV